MIQPKRKRDHGRDSHWNSGLGYALGAYSEEIPNSSPRLFLLRDFNVTSREMKKQKKKGFQYGVLLSPSSPASWSVDRGHVPVRRFYERAYRERKVVARDWQKLELRRS